MLASDAVVFASDAVSVRDANTVMPCSREASDTLLAPDAQSRAQALQPDGSLVDEEALVAVVLAAVHMQAGDAARQVDVGAHTGGEHMERLGMDQEGDGDGGRGEEGGAREEGGWWRIRRAGKAVHWRGSRGGKWGQSDRDRKFWGAGIDRVFPSSLPDFTSEFGRDGKDGN